MRSATLARLVQSNLRRRIGLWEGTTLAVGDGILVAIAVGVTTGRWIEAVAMGICVAGITISTLAWLTWRVAIALEREANDRLDRIAQAELRRMGFIVARLGLRQPPSAPPGILIPMRPPRPGRRPN